MGAYAYCRECEGPLHLTNESSIRGHITCETCGVNHEIDIEEHVSFLLDLEMRVDKLEKELKLVGRLYLRLSQYMDISS